MILIIQRIEVFVIALMKFFCVFMGVNRRIAHALHHRDRDVRAAVGDALKVDEQVKEDSAGVDVAFAAPEAFQVVFLHRVAEVVDDFFNRLNGTG